MANIFDQFDEAPATVPQSGNVFDQFDEQPQQEEAASPGFLPESIRNAVTSGVDLLINPEVNPYGFGGMAMKAGQAAAGMFGMEREASGEVVTDVVEDVVGGLYEGGRRLVDPESNPYGAFGLAQRGGRALTEAVTGEEAAQLPEYEGNYPVITEIAATAPAAIGGGVTAYRTIATNAPKVLRFAIASIGEAAGFASTQQRGDDRLLFGEDSLAGLPTLVEDEGGFNQFINDFTDAVAIAYPGTVGADLAIRAGLMLHTSIIKPAMNLFKTEKEAGLAESITRRIIDKLGVARNADNPAERERALVELGVLIRENQEFLTRIGDQDIRFYRDTMSAIEQGAGTESQIGMRARELRAGHMSGQETAQTKEMLSTPSRQAQDALTQTEDALGGMPAIRQAEEGIQTQARRQFDEAFEQPVARTEEQMHQRMADIPDAIRDDAVLGPRLQQLDQNVETNIFAARDQSVDEIRTNVRQAYDAMQREKDEILARIPDDLRIDYTPIQDILDSPTIPSHIKTMIDDTDTFFKDQYQNVVPKISREISARIKAGRGDVDELIALRDFINEAGPDDFRNWYRETYAPIWRDGKLEDFADVYRQTTRRDGIRPVDFEVGTRKIIQEAIRDPAEAEHLMRLLSRPEAQSNPQLVSDVVLGEVAGRVQSQLNSGRPLREIDVDGLIRSLEDYGAVFARNFPDQKKRLDDFATRLRDARQDVNKLSKELDRLTRLRDEGEKQIFNNQYREFFDQHLRASQGSFQPFERLLGKDGNIERISDILNIAREAGDDAVVEGMQAAYLRHLRNEMFGGSSRVPGGAKALNLEKFRAADQGESSLFEYGREIFRDTPDVFDASLAFLREADRLQQSIDKVPQLVPFDYGEFARQTSRGWDRIITLTLGVLNRAAARGRSLKGAAVEITNPEQQANYISDKLLSNPQYFQDTLERIIQQDAAGTTPEMRRSIEGFILLMGKDTIAPERQIREELESIPEEVWQEQSSLDQQTHANLNIDEILYQDNLDQTPWFHKEPENAKQDRLPANRGRINERFGPESEEFQDYNAFTLMDWTPEALERLQDQMRLSDSEQEELARVLNQDAERTNLAHRRARADRAVQENTQRGPQYPQQRR